MGTDDSHSCNTSFFYWIYEESTFSHAFRPNLFEWRASHEQSHAKQLVSRRKACCVKVILDVLALSSTLRSRNSWSMTIFVVESLTCAKSRARRSPHWLRMATTCHQPQPHPPRQETQKHQAPVAPRTQDFCNQEECSHHTGLQLSSRSRVSFGTGFAYAFINIAVYEILNKLRKKCKKMAKYHNEY